MTSKEQSVTMDAASPIVECHDLDHVYERGGRNGRLFGRGGARRQSVTALDGVSLSVEPGEIVGLAGPSGSGKSTLLHLVAALETPTSGRVVLAGHETHTLSASQRTALRLSTVGIIFQRFHLLSALSARANVALPLVEEGVGKRARRKRADDLLERVGLGDRADHRPGELSGGEQQRVAIARALVTDPALLVADEPTGELDTTTGHRVLEVLSEVATDRAVILASHDEDTLAIADRLINLQDGRIHHDD